MDQIDWRFEPLCRGTNDESDTPSTTRDVLHCLSRRENASCTDIGAGGLNPGDSYHLVFGSSGRNDANFGGISGADAFVQGLADSAGVGNTAGITWQEILSDSSTNAISRFNPTHPYTTCKVIA